MRSRKEVKVENVLSYVQVLDFQTDAENFRGNESQRLHELISIECQSVLKLLPQSGNPKWV